MQTGKIYLLFEEGHPDFGGYQHCAFIDTPPTSGHYSASDKPLIHSVLNSHYKIGMPLSALDSIRRTRVYGPSTDQTNLHTADFDVFELLTDETVQTELAHLLTLAISDATARTAYRPAYNYREVTAKRAEGVLSEMGISDVAAYHTWMQERFFAVDDNALSQIIGFALTGHAPAGLDCVGFVSVALQAAILKANGFFTQTISLTASGATLTSLTGSAEFNCEITKVVESIVSNPGKRDSFNHFLPVNWQFDGRILPPDILYAHFENTEARLIQKIGSLSIRDQYTLDGSLDGFEARFNPSKHFSVTHTIAALQRYADADAAAAASTAARRHSVAAAAGAGAPPHSGARVAPAPAIAQVLKNSKDAPVNPCCVIA